MRMAGMQFFHSDPPPLENIDTFSILTFLIVSFIMLHIAVGVMVEEFHSGLYHMMRTMGLMQVTIWRPS